MDNTQHNSAKFAFFYMLSLVALVFMAIATGMIIFQIINKNIVDVLEQFSSRFSADQLKFAISALLISAPIFYITTRLIFKNLYAGTLNKDAGVRKWLTYFILFVAAVVVIGWLIGIVNSFLGGEITLKFIFKAITAIGISAIIFSFYLYDMRRENIVGAKDKVIRIYFYGSLIIVIATFIAALFIVESPTEARDRRLDNAILDNFNQIDRAMNDYYSDYSKLPASLDELVTDINILTDDDIKDPISKEKFGYNIKEANVYEICANFKTSNKDELDVNKYEYTDKRWLHDAGEQCLSQKVRGRDSNIPIREREPMPIP